MSEMPNPQLQPDVFIPLLHTVMHAFSGFEKSRSPYEVLAGPGRVLNSPR